jgi:hypothetical protein
LVQERRVFPCGLPLKCFQEIVLEIVSHAMVICQSLPVASRRARRPSRRRCCICARHRARLSASLRPRMRAASGP